MNRRTLAAGGLTIAASMAVVASAAVPASAGHVKAHVLVMNGATNVAGATIPVTPGTANLTLTTLLDDGCLQPFNNGQSFGMLGTDDNPSVATLTPPSHSGLKCDDDVRTFDVHAIANGSTTLHFDVDATNGLQGQTAGASVTVSATGFPTDGGPNPPGHARPAAPAVVNGFLNTQSQLDTCKNHYDGTHNWRGQLLRAVAHWAAANHLGKAKNSMADSEWITKVQNEVDSICGPVPQG